MGAQLYQDTIKVRLQMGGGRWTTNCLHYYKTCSKSRPPWYEQFVMAIMFVMRQGHRIIQMRLLLGIAMPGPSPPPQGPLPQGSLLLVAKVSVT